MDILQGIGLRQYRGIGKEMQSAYPLKKCNFFIGANNTGKSTFLNFISSHLDVISGRTVKNKLEFNEFETHLGSTSSQIGIRIGFSSLQVIEVCLGKLSQNNLNMNAGRIERLINSLSDSGFFWINIDPVDAKSIYLDKDYDQIKNNIDHNSWAVIWQMLVPSGATSIDAMVPYIVSWIVKSVEMKFPSAHLIPAMRRIGAKDHGFDDYTGSGLIDKLAELQNPGPSDRILRKKFEKINNFLKEITGDESVQIEVPHDRQEILVHKDGRVLPLSSLGTGIHEVVMISSFCTLIEDGIVCIEEPEVHLHPLLQKKLIRYLNEKTTNQYFIATHSASIIDLSGAAIFHVTQVDATTNIELAAESAQRFRVCQDLGYRASDILQTNFIIWVEGPTDRIYLNHWIGSVNKDLQEGINYSIMFYGGRLLSHLNANDDDVEDFISLRRLNRNMAILIDSDKKTQESQLNATKNRIIEEFEKGADIAWVTAGREIENYLTAETLNSALRTIYPNFEKVASNDRYEHRLTYHEIGADSGTTKDADKVKVAREACRHPADLTVFDLKNKIQGLVSRIESSNT